MGVETMHRAAFLPLTKVFPAMPDFHVGTFGSLHMWGKLARQARELLLVCDEPVQCGSVVCPRVDFAWDGAVPQPVPGGRAPCLVDQHPARTISTELVLLESVAPAGPSDSSS